MKEKFKNSCLKIALIGLCAVAIMFGLSAGSALAHEAEPHPHAEDSKVGDTKYKNTEHGSLSNIGNKLANPVSDIWGLSMSFNMPQFYDGDVNKGDPQLGATTVFQPLMPIPLYGTGKDQWRMIARPVVPIIFSEPIVKGFDEFSHVGGLGDIQLPLLLVPSERIAGNFILGAGPVMQFPTATRSDLGANQWALGPAAVIGYKTKNKKITAGIFPNYFWKIGSASQGNNTRNVNKMSLLYFFTYNLPNAWQFGMNPTITYNHNTDGPDQWKVPVGLYVGKTMKIGNLPVNMKFGGEYSVVSPDTFGNRYQFRFQFTPVIRSLIKNPIFGK